MARLNPTKKAAAPKKAKKQLRKIINVKLRNSKDKLPKVKTGIEGFDEMVNGGFEEGSINLIAGSAGAGKTLFAAQYLLNGIVKYGEAGIYVTFEEKKEKFYRNMESIGYDMKKIDASGKFLFLEYTPEQVRNVLIEGGGIIDSMIEKLKAKRLVFDSVTSFSLLYDDELSKKEAALSLFDLMGKWGCTALLTSQNESDDDLRIKVSLDFEVDSVILLYHTIQKGQRIRALEVLKMRRTKHSEKIVLAEIRPQGIIVNPNKKVSCFG